MTNRTPFKFRVRNTKLNRWVSKLEIAEIKDCSENNGLIGILAYTEETDPESQLAKDCVVQQYTGILDQDDREIYDGDIISGELDTKYHRSQMVRIAVVFNFGAFNISSLDWNKASFKVIGNIFENPELL